jgi:hypothetical protein
MWPRRRGPRAAPEGGSDEQNNGAQRRHFGATGGCGEGVECRVDRLVLGQNLGRGEERRQRVAACNRRQVGLNRRRGLCPPYDRAVRRLDRNPIMGLRQSRRNLLVYWIVRVMIVVMVTVVAMRVRHHVGVKRILMVRMNENVPPGTAIEKQGGEEPEEQ